MPVGVMLGLQDELTLTIAFFPSDGHDVKFGMKSILTKCASRLSPDSGVALLERWRIRIMEQNQ